MSLSSSSYCPHSAAPDKPSPNATTCPYAFSLILSTIPAECPAAISPRITNAPTAPVSKYRLRDRRVGGAGANFSTKSSASETELNDAAEREGRWRE